jgi:hypothetical protein
MRVVVVEGYKIWRLYHKMAEASGNVRDILFFYTVAVFVFSPEAPVP